MTTQRTNPILKANPAARVPVISQPLLELFRYIARGYFRRNFHGVRTSHKERFTAHAQSGGPLLVYANHSSWWDPMVSTLLGDRMMRNRQHYAPMDAEALERYGILKRIGVFGVEMKTARGAAQFLRVGKAVMASGGVLWITPQGQFVDMRVRPLEFKPGLAALALRAAQQHGSCTVQPMAIEYPFWDERLPECLLHFADSVTVLPTEDQDAVQDRLRTALETAMDELRQISVQRNPLLFETLVAGRAGTGGFYEIGQRIKAFLRGQQYQPEHTRIPAAHATQGESNPLGSLPIEHRTHADATGVRE